MLIQRSSWGIKPTTLLESNDNAQLTFKERMKEAWHRKPPIMETAQNPETINHVSMATYCVSMLIIFGSSVFYIIPAICPNEDLSHVGLFLKLLVFLNHTVCNANWALCSERKTQMVKETTLTAEDRETLATSSYLPLGYRFCNSCQLYTPPRAHHCKMCHACVLKRDYHCYVTGSCVGFTSQRRYLPWLFNITAGALLHMSICAYYVNSQLPFVKEYVTYVPFVALSRCFMGELNFSIVYVMLQMYFCMSVMVVAWSYLMWEWLMVIRGQTSYEATRSIQTYRIGIAKNLHMVFGPIWYLNFIFPLPTTIPCNGVHWERRSQQKGN